MGLFVYFHLYD
eukprot:UN18676